MNDNTFDVLAHEQRRPLLRAHLEETPQEVGVGSPAGESAPADGEHRSRIARDHRHSLDLDGYGYIGGHRDAQETVRGPGFEENRPLLGWLADHAERADRNGRVKP